MDDTRTYPKSYKEKTKAAMELFVLCNQFWYLCTSCLTNGRKCNGEAATSAGYFAPTTSATTSSGSHLSHIQQILPMQLRLSLGQLISFTLVFAAPTSASNCLYEARYGKFVSRMEKNAIQ